MCLSFFFLLKSWNSFTLWQNLIYPFSISPLKLETEPIFLCSSFFTRLTSVTCSQFEYRIRFLLIFMHFFFFIYYFLSFSERWVRPTSYQHFCRCSWWRCMFLLVIRLWRTSLHTLAKYRYPRQNECKKKGSVMNKSFFVSLTHHCTQTSSRPTPNLQGIVLGTRLVPSHSQPSWQ